MLLVWWLVSMIVSMFLYVWVLRWENFIVVCGMAAKERSSKLNAMIGMDMECVLLLLLLDACKFASVFVWIWVERISARFRKEGKTISQLWNEQHTITETKKNTQERERENRQNRKLKQNEESYLCCHGYLALFNDPLFFGGRDNWMCLCEWMDRWMYEGVSWAGNRYYWPAQNFKWITICKCDLDCYVLAN